MNKKTIQILVLFLFFLLTTFLVFNRHSRVGIQNYHSQIWADKAGYYMYLPATLKYQFDASQMPDSIDKKTGYGFQIDKDENKIITKYTSGIALLQLPFYLLADGLAEPLGFEKDGFSQIYHWSIDLAASFYLVLGLFLLWLFLKERFKNNIALVTVISLFLATNLYYYAIEESGLSHVYSFMLFSCVLYYFQKTNYLQKISLINYFNFGILAGLIILIRPTGVLFLTAFLFLDANKFSIVYDRIKRILNWKAILPFIIAVLIVVTPQLLYWNHVFGSYISYSYTEEGFNWLNPQFALTFISPNNGLFLYTPLYLLIVISLLVMAKKKEPNAFYLLTLFGCISYVFASWDSWWFGCAFGARSYVEYLAIFSISLAIAISKMIQYRNWSKWLLGSLLILFAVYNLKMIYSFDGCFEGSRYWDWPAYYKFLFSPVK